MRIHLGSDHAGFALKERVKAYMQAEGHAVTDVGTFDEGSVDYPVYAHAVARAVADGEADFGVLVCGTGLGMAIAANKVRGVRAAQATSPEFARMARLHNDANVVALAGRYTDAATAESILDAFLGTAFEGGRHQRRVDMMDAIGHDETEGE